MKYSEWEGEVARVAEFLHLDEKDTRSLIAWSEMMAHDSLEYAGKYFNTADDFTAVDRAFNRLDERLWETFGDLADQLIGPEPNERPIFGTGYDDMPAGVEPTGAPGEAA